MLQTLKRLAKMTAGYSMVLWAGPFLSLIFTPIITRILTPADYGIADYLSTIGSAIGTVALLALPQAVAAHFNDQAELAWQRRVVGSAVALVTVIGALVGAGLVLLAPALAEASPITRGYAYLFQWMGMTSVFGLAGPVLTSAAQAALRVRWGMALSSTAILGTVFGNVLFIVIMRLGVTGMVLTPIVTSVAICLVALTLTRGLIGRPSSTTARLLLVTGATLLPAAVSSWVLLVADRIFLAQYVQAQELGYYAIANKIATLAYVLLAPIFTAYTPLALSMQHRPDARESYARLARYLTAVTLCAGLALGLFATELLQVLTRTEYLPAAQYVGFLTYMHTFGAVGTILYVGGMAGKQFRGIMWTALAGAAVNLALNATLIPSYGVWGATAATVVGCAVSPVLLYLWLRQRYPVPYPVARIIAAFVIQLALLVVGLSIPPLPFVIRVSLKASVLLLLALSYIPLGMVTRAEWQQARGLAQHQWDRYVLPLVHRKPLE
jgi:O-antigen/teichoic acid export membrane protein